MDSINLEIKDFIRFTGINKSNSTRIIDSMGSLTDKPKFTVIVIVTGKWDLRIKVFIAFIGANIPKSMAVINVTDSSTSTVADIIIGDGKTEEFIKL